MGGVIVPNPLPSRKPRGINGLVRLLSFIRRVSQDYISLAMLRAGIPVYPSAIKRRQDLGPKPETPHNLPVVPA